MIKGYFTSGASARSLPSEISFQGSLISFNGRLYRFDEVSISERIGNSPRYICFPGGEEFETTDNDPIDLWLDGINEHRTLRKISLLERHLGLAIVVGVFMAAFVGFLVFDGIQRIAGWLAPTVPVEWRVTLSEGTEEWIDSSFEDTEIPILKQQELTKTFKAWTENSQYPYQLKFVHYEDTPNAFALPSGTIYVTDALIKMAESNEEVMAVLAHEIGHVEAHHGMEMVIESSFLSGLLLVMLGDVSQLDSLAVGLPTALLQSSYSRDKEREADAFAIDWLVKKGEDPQALVSIFKKFEAYEAEDLEPEKGDETEEATEPKDAGEPSKLEAILDVFSTHPATDERIQLMQERIRQIKQTQ